MTFTRVLWIAFISLIAMAGGRAELSPLASASERAKDKLITPLEVIQRLTASKTKYVITPAEDLKDVSAEKFGDVLWPEGEAVALPKISKSADGMRMTLTTYPASDEALKLLKEGDVLFEAKKFDEAMVKYRELVGRFPDFYKGWVYLGDAMFTSGRYPEALEAYSKGVELNPYDYQGHLFKGHALVKLDRYEEALQELVRTLSLRPHQPTAMNILMSYRGALGIDVNDTRFKPAALVRREGKDIKIYYTPAQPAWLSWANCKALWLGEPSYRKKKTGTEEYHWSSTEDWECLANLYATRSMEIQEKTGKPDEVLDRVTRIGEDHMLFEMMTYDIVSRVAPDALLLMPETARDELEDYIRRYVVVRHPPKPPAPPAGGPDSKPESDD